MMIWSEAHDDPFLLENANSTPKLCWQLSRSPRGDLYWNSFYAQVLFIGGIESIYTVPGDFARVASPKMMSDCHMLRMNVCDAGRHAGTQRNEKGLTFIRVRAWLARATGAGQTASFGTPAGL